MKTIKEWFDIHDTTYAGSAQKRPISTKDDPRLVWLENEFPCYVKGIQETSVASGMNAFTDETFQALLFSTKSTVETTKFLLAKGANFVLTRKLNSDPIEALFGRIRSVCGGNDMLDARAVTAALDHFVKEKTLAAAGEVKIPDADTKDLAPALPPALIEELRGLREHPGAPSRSVTYSGLGYVGGYIVKLISDFGCDSCVMLLTQARKMTPCLCLCNVKTVVDSITQSQSFLLSWTR